MSDSIHKRKSEHIEITLNEKVTGDHISTGFEKVSFIHNALPEIDFSEISLKTNFLDHTLKTPFLISSMTGGAALAESINRHLAEAAEQRGWTLALGSTRALIESKDHRSSFQVRKYAPNVPIITNLGAVQLNYGFGIEECQQIIEITDANMLVLHLNSIQEVIQQEGNTNFKSLLGKIEKLCQKLNVPVGVKEVGWGIDGMTAKKLTDVGIAFIDVAGAGGTSWSQVEKFRAKDKVKAEAAEAFSEWGIPTAECVISVRKQIEKQPIVASGGMRTGLDAAKAIAIGADMIGFGRSILKEATQSTEDVMRVMETRELELQMAMFGIGCSSLEELKQTDRVKL
ncbi:type 2 isopentenyl-diphosphate Delta-isomerase [Lederbergia galactosidilytica]|uniref:Isopentenyl-diphosphate delta-isomerase n=1 Tax=Lederbergia galactosidilytica TaxID=217031 RepID=A0A177ZQH8_9BACI|nr:type 2 isopentenyl-diphosphate Delta-isomerase [Lederbergia galactosidilytica]KRG14881.1 isopentenyl pyrophosphate isomerase [Virgibacillus soli]MBP1914563.1 isopentenyl-diphosphate delta-isomerase [Lederbergia galactosidilytica]OAK69128.1 isopentenyl pyrophosphate isomerase [Lederbergia galactosidilytica]